MEERIAILGIVVKNEKSITDTNDVLHKYNEYIMGRLGLPRKDMNIITIIIKANEEILNNISEDINGLKGIECNIMQIK